MLLLYSGPLFSIFPPISFPPVPLLRSHLSLQLFFVIPSQLFIIFLTRLTLLLCFFLFLASPSLPSRLLLTFSSQSNYYPFSLLSSHKIFPFFSFCNLVYLAPFSTFVSSLLFFHFLSHLLPYFSLQLSHMLPASLFLVQQICCCPNHHRDKVVVSSPMRPMQLGSSENRPPLQKQVANSSRVWEKSPSPRGVYTIFHFLNEIN